MGTRAGPPGLRRKARTPRRGETGGGLASREAPAPPVKPMLHTYHVAVAMGTTFIFARQSTQMCATRQPAPCTLPLSQGFGKLGRLLSRSCSTLLLNKLFFGGYCDYTCAKKGGCLPRENRGGKGQEVGCAGGKRPLDAPSF